VTIVVAIGLLAVFLLLSKLTDLDDYNFAEWIVFFFVLSIIGSIIALFYPPITASLVTLSFSSPAAVMLSMIYVMIGAVVANMIESKVL
jgi:hypothetical protein